MYQNILHIFLLSEKKTYFSFVQGTDPPPHPPIFRHVRNKQVFFIIDGIDAFPCRVCKKITFLVKLSPMTLFIKMYTYVCFLEWINRIYPYKNIFLFRKNSGYIYFSKQYISLSLKIFTQLRWTCLSKPDDYCQQLYKIVYFFFNLYFGMMLTLYSQLMKDLNLHKFSGPKIQCVNRDINKLILILNYGGVL